MPTEEFTANATSIKATWLNDIDFHVYDVCGGPASLAAFKVTLHASPGAIGSGTPSTGAFTTIAASSTTDLNGDVTVAGHLTMDGSAKQIRILDGDASAPGLVPSSDTNTGIYSAGADILGFSTGGTARARIAGGFFQASNAGTGYEGTVFHEHISNAAQNVLQVTNSHASTPNGVKIKFSGAAPDNNTQTFLECADNSATRLYIWSDGDVQNHDNTYGAISDERLKQDIVDSGSQWSDIKALRVRKYRLKSDVAKGKDSVHIGLVAQEVMTVSPGLVSDNGDQLGLHYSLVSVKLLKAFQEAQARIEALESEVKALKK